jgi:hypothetical protein
MVSVEGEVVELEAAVPAGEAVEAWLAQLAGAMRGTLQRLVGAAGALPDPLRQAAGQVLGLHKALEFTARCVCVGGWGVVVVGCSPSLLLRPSMPMGLAAPAPPPDLLRPQPAPPAVRARSVEQAIAGGGVPRLAARLRAELQALARQDLGGSPLLQLRRANLVLDYVHQLDVLAALQQAQPAGPGDWAWSRQLRYYRQQVRCRPRRRPRAPASRRAAIARAAPPRGGRRAGPPTCQLPRPPRPPAALPPNLPPRRTALWRCAWRRRASPTAGSTRATRPSWCTRRSQTGAT